MTQPHFAILTLLAALALGACSNSHPAGDAQRKAPDAATSVANRVAITVGEAQVLVQ